MDVASVIGMNDDGKNVSLNKEQQSALALMMSGVNVFLTGEAGTGKSTLVREYIRQCSHECIVLAPTGIAALNAGGTTIHSQLLLRPGLLNPLALDPLSDGNRCRALRAAKAIVVDEISMVRSDLFCAMDARLREIASGENRRRPFGGRQMILVGDFMQLPPVTGSAEERKFVDERMGGPFAFQTDLWNAAMFRTVFLRTTHRQSGDALFRKVLGNLRHGNFEAAANVLNNHCVGEKSFSSPPICLCTTNREAKSVNDAARKSAKGASRTFVAQITGRFPESEFPAEAKLDLAVGARVMVLCNQRNEGVLECVNGDMGVVVDLGSDDEAEVGVRLDSGKTVTMAPHTWEKCVYGYANDPKTKTPVMRQEVIGAFMQIPLRLAYAITIHKSQGLSLDCVSLHLGRGCFDHGQLYTALSRCRTLAGLGIDRRLMPEDLIVDDAVVKFYSALEDCHGEDMGGDRWYDEAMQYYLRRLETGSGEIQPGGMAQSEFDFSPRICDHPDLATLCKLFRQGAINKYDLPILAPLAQSAIDKVGVKENELATITRLIAKYKA